MTPERPDVDLKLDGAEEEWEELGVSNHRHILVSTDWRRWKGERVKGWKGAPLTWINLVCFILHNSIFPSAGVSSPGFIPHHNFNTPALLAGASDFFSTRLDVSQVPVALRASSHFQPAQQQQKKKHPPTVTERITPLKVKWMTNSSVNSVNSARRKRLLLLLPNVSMQCAVSLRMHTKQGWLLALLHRSNQDPSLERREEEKYCRRILQDRNLNVSRIEVSYIASSRKCIVWEYKKKCLQGFFLRQPCF